MNDDFRPGRGRISLRIPQGSGTMVAREREAELGVGTGMCHDEASGRLRELLAANDAYRFR